MASLSDQIDRLSRNTRSISSTASQISPSVPGLFTRAVLNTHLGDLIRDIDPSELGLFRLVQNPSSSSYDNDARSAKDPVVRRTEFTGATPLRNHSTRREDKQDIEPEVYARAALKYIEQYEPIRPMPRAYDQIITILNRLNQVRANIKSLSATLKQTTVDGEIPSAKVRVEQEEQRIKDLRARMAELSKENTTKMRKPTAERPRIELVEPPIEAVKPPPSPSSPQEKFWTTPGEPSRVLRFSDNLLDEEVNLGDMSSASFGSPLAGSSKLRPQSLFGEVDEFNDEPSVLQYKASYENYPEEEESDVPDEDNAERLTSPDKDNISPKTSTVPAQIVLPDDVDDLEAPDTVTDTPTAPRERKIKVNIEVERIVSKIWSTVGDIVMPHKPVLSVNETIAHLQQLAAHSPQPESPIASTVSSISAEGSSSPTLQQIQTAHLLITLLSTAPHYSMPLNEVKRNLALKAGGSEGVGTGHGSTRVLYQCMGKRLIKIDRGGREQIVKFDI